MKKIIITICAICVARTDHFGGGNLNETFSYTGNNDKLNRLTDVQGPQNISMTYKPNGNMDTKTDVGVYVYNNAKLHAVESVDNPVGLVSTTQQDISYTPFDKTSFINENDNQLTITYGADQQRIQADLVNVNTGPVNTVYYADNYEKEIKGNTTTEINYISGGDGLCAMYVVTNGTGAMHYVYSDHLGSILTLTNEQGQVTGRQSFDAWGRQRNAGNWLYIQQTSLVMPSWLRRGYTGHEHLPAFGLINMNGRMYDPILSKVLSPDNYVADATSSQTFNRYAYCFNNPLKYIDPDGDNPMLGALALFIVGATADHFINYAEYGHTSKKQAFKAGFTDGVRAYDQINSVTQIPVYNNHGVSVAVGPSLTGAGITGGISYAPGDMIFSLGGGAFAGTGFTWGGAITFHDRSSDDYFSIFYSHFGKRNDFFGNIIGSQNIAGIGYRHKKFSIRTDNDIFALEHEDRWRTGSLEVGYGSIIAGFRIYENDPKGEGSEIDLNGTNAAGQLNRPNDPAVGAWKRGFVYESAFYVGYKSGATVAAIGVNHPLVQDKTQNPIHRWVPFGRQNYYNNYSQFQNQGFYSASWTFNPYSPYGYW